MGNSLIRLVAAAWLAATATQAGAEEVKFTVIGTGGAPISGAALFGGGDQDVRMAVSYTGVWQFDIEAGNTEVLLGKRDPDGAVLRRVNIGQSFVAKKGTRKVECRLACFIPDVGLILEF